MPFWKSASPILTSFPNFLEKILLAGPLHWQAGQATQKPTHMLQLATSPYLLHFCAPAPTSRGVLTQRTIWLVRIWQRQQPTLNGWGECGPLPSLSRDDHPHFGAAVAEQLQLFNKAGLQRIADAQRWLERWVAPLPSFAFGVETALRDLANGGRRQLWDTPFARGERGLPTHGLIWMDDPAGLQRQVEAKIAAGFRTLKLKIGARPFEEELDLLRWIRAAAPEIELRLDANGAFEPAEALDRLDRLAAFQIALVEQPVQPGHWGVLADLSRHSPVPIALDEELIGVHTADQRRALLETVRPQYLILKPALLGGFSAAEAWIAEAESRSIRWLTNSLLESNLGLNALCQWTSAVGGERTHGLGTGTLFANNIPSPLRLTGCRLTLGDPRGWQLPEQQSFQPFDHSASLGI